MPQKTSKCSSDKWASLLQKALGTRERRPAGDGWVTLAQWCVKHSIAKQRALKLLNSLIASGDAECFAGVLLNEHRHLVRQVWYRPK
jgi:hypothetical protein